ncbi:SagB/ThcOx family dehydrogenase [Priestia megaterium]|uniref:SagB/ThcOx family dehydrogenase n=1 Tax=Priestia megaterium TaxID=1404 RepID=UPI002EC8C360|nr:SagB/ThcOx family dehydrogenase [Priestia megaterium]
MKKTRDLKEEFSLHQFYHQNTILTYAERYKKPVSFPVCPPKKMYPKLNKIYLSTNDNDTNNGNHITLRKAIKNRKSTRVYNKNNITLEQLSTLLYYSYGVIHMDSDGIIRRPPASAGARYPIELYIVVNNVKDLRKGIYHYNAEEHALCELPNKQYSVSDWALLSSGNEEIFEKSSFLIVMTSIFEKSIQKYGERGYRYILLDAGHIGQNLYLMSTDLEIGCVETGGYYEQEIERSIEIDGVREGVIHLVAFGN